MRRFGRRLQALATVVGVVPFAISQVAQAQQTANLTNCSFEFFDPKDPTGTGYYYVGAFPISPAQGPKSHLGAHAADQVSVAVFPNAVQLNTALAQAFPTSADQGQDVLVVELFPDAQDQFALKASVFHRSFHLTVRPQALEMFALRKSDGALLARSGSVATGASANAAGAPDATPNLELGAGMLSSAISIVILDERGQTYYQADYTLDINAMQRRAATALVTGRRLYEGADFDTASGPNGGQDNCAVDGAGDQYDEYCFLTTATVRTIGLEDRCWELQQLRAFRDRFAELGSRQRAEMAQYYAISPAIVRAIDARRDGRSIWLRVYFAAILPAAIAAGLRCDRLALAIYRRLVMRLVAMTQPGVAVATD
jgi:hypothetical protein